MRTLASFRCCGGEGSVTRDGGRNELGWHGESHERRTCRHRLPALATSLCCSKDGSTTGNGEMGAMGWRDGGGGRDGAIAFAVSLHRVGMPSRRRNEGGGVGRMNGGHSNEVGVLPSPPHVRTSKQRKHESTCANGPTRHQPAKIHTDVDGRWESVTP
ncbi:hypothetical protein SCHPADRAFT_691107 [Schizopora paradoxa]|uniref:Uncharacterized protein n=1 Tax=Schizopora paradoxa TaxID=27342 RepID=A0A0H2RAC3_9AGAM|nr:hypothetical protein SCHPADRAFT_691107 [Schizopora paradoxa]